MTALPLLGLLLLAQNPDSIASPTGMVATNPSIAPAPSEAPAHPWAVQLAFRNGIEWGDLRKAEQDMADRTNLVITDDFGNEAEPFVLLNPIGLEATIWRTLDPSLDVGLAARWTIVMAKISNASEPILRSTSVFAKVRWLPIRNEYSEMGIHAGFGAMWGTLNRYPFLQDATPSADTPAEIVELNEYWFSLAHEDVSLSGFGGEIGPALEFPITPRFSVGGSLLFTWDNWTMTESDPIAGTDADYPQSPSDKSITLDLHVAAHF